RALYLASFSTGPAHITAAPTLCRSPQHCRSCLQVASSTFGTSGLDSSPPEHMENPAAMSTPRITKPSSCCFAVTEGLETPQCGQVLAEVETSFLHSLHLVIAMGLLLHVGRTRQKVPITQSLGG